MPVNLDPDVRFPTGWKMPVGKPLTNARIAFYAREGRYGKAAQDVALKKVTVRNGIVLRCCQCQSSINVKYLRWSYLPNPGHFCAKCVAVLKDARDREREQEKKFNEALMKEYE